MIRNFRIEVEGFTKEESVEKASLVGSQFIGFLREIHHQLGEYECTDDVTSLGLNRGTPIYITRMKFVYRGAHGA